MSSSAEVHLSIEPGAGRARLVLAGRIGTESAARLHQAALEVAGGTGDVMVCCDRVEHMSAAALQVLVCLGREVMQSGRRCDLSGVNGPLREVFGLAGLGPIPSRG